MQNVKKEKMMFNNEFFIGYFSLQGVINMIFGSFIKLTYGYYTLGLCIFLSGLLMFSLFIVIQGLKIEFDRKKASK